MNRLKIMERIESKASPAGMTTFRQVADYFLDRWITCWIIYSMNNTIPNMEPHVVDAVFLQAL